MPKPGKPVVTRRDVIDLARELTVREQSCRSNPKLKEVATLYEVGAALLAGILYLGTEIRESRRADR